ncbi:MAG: hypothetical protein HPY66_3286 [Firmicutes bacterium]|nr:hypothetical protein [Bacillota bacterium]
MPSLLVLFYYFLPNADKLFCENVYYGDIHFTPGNAIISAGGC